MACSQKRTHLLIGEALDAQQILKNHGSKFCQVQVMIDLIHMLRGIGMKILRTWQAYASLASCRLLSTFGTLPSFPTSLAHGEGDGLRSIETRIFQLLQVRRVDAWILSRKLIKNGIRNSPCVRSQTPLCQLSIKSLCGVRKGNWHTIDVLLPSSSAIYGKQNNIPHNWKK